MYLFSRSKFVGLLSLPEQINHLLSEVAEVQLAYGSPYITRVGEELWDVVHSAETALRMLEERSGGDDIAVAIPAPSQAVSLLPLYSQLKRLTSQVELVRAALATASVQRVASALLNVIGSAYSALDLLAKVYHVDVDACRRNVITKNTDRGYYGSVQPGSDRLPRRGALRGCRPQPSRLPPFFTGKR